MSISEFDVAIVGCGPVGATAANILSHRGISTVVVEALWEPYELPRAIHLDHEIMRAFQSAGIADQIYPHLSQPAGAMDFGADLSVIRQLQKIVRNDCLGWASDYHFYQPDLERILGASLAARANAQVFWGHSVTSFEQDPTGITILAQGSEGPVSLRAKYLLGCDGGRSLVRRQIGAKLDDLGFDEPWVVVDVLVDGALTMPAFKGVPDDVNMQEVMFIIGDPARPTSVIPGVAKHRRWEFMMLPDEEAGDFADGNRVQQLIAPWIGDQKFELIRSAVYRFHALVADRWQDRRVFLLGDAAHQTPPFFGQGLCHGIRDAANLAWKLQMVLQGKAVPGLLDTFQMEREPQVRAVINASVRRGRYICTLDATKARLRDIEMKELAERTPPAYVDLIPAIERGILGPSIGTPSPVGTRFIQPPMVDETGRRALLDDLTGSGLRLFTSEQLCLTEGYQALADASKYFLSLFRVHRASPCSLTFGTLGDPSGEFHQWLDHFNSLGLVLRPDGYVYGVFSNLEEASALVQTLIRQLNADCLTQLWDQDSLIKPVDG